VNNLAALYFVSGDWNRAAELWRRSTAAIARREQLGAGNAGVVLTGKRKSETAQNSWQFWGLVKTVQRHAAKSATLAGAATREMFETAQWAQSSEAAASLAQMASRGASGDARLAGLVRERQDRLAEWRRGDGLRNAWLGLPTDKRNAQAEAENAARLGAIETRIAEIDKELAAKFPDYAALASPAPLSVDEVQAQLGRGEALVLILATPEWKPVPEETFIWVVTKTDVRWLRSELGTEALTREVAALRCGLDAANWYGAAQDCEALTNAKPARTIGGEVIPATLPFDMARAHKLYQALFGQAEDLIKGKSLIIVPSGPLTQLPFQVLVTAQPANADYKSAAWLARDHAITVLPAVSSLKALRRVARESAATKPMIGFGNPLLDGPDYSYDALARQAREKQRCPKTLWQKVASLVNLRAAATTVQTRGGIADSGRIKKDWAPLPDTADELCAVARDVSADESDIYLGSRATEHEIKKLSAEGKLAQYRIVHFATHGSVAGQVSGSNEPGLILTPPDKPSEDDDGYLSASDIAGLKLDADWVILSACNTAAGGAQSAEALSGLARAFIYAQARALLVSHWEVDSAATVKLVTGAMKRLAKDKTMGRAEAMRQSMLDLIDHGEHARRTPPIGRRLSSWAKARGKAAVPPRAAPFSPSRAQCGAKRCFADTGS
jgi:CHAT domain-containing protein